VPLPAKGYGLTEFEMSQARAEALMSAAKDATIAYLDELEARAEIEPATGQA